MGGAPHLLGGGQSLGLDGRGGLTDEVILQGSETTVGVWRAGLSLGTSSLAVKIPQDSGTYFCSPQRLTGRSLCSCGDQSAM